MRDILRTATLLAAGAVLALLLARSCSSPPPVVVDAVELHRIETERARLAEEVAREHAAIDARARELAGLPLYERIEVLTVSESARRAASVSESARAPAFDKDAAPGAVSKPDRCRPTGDGHALCPEWVLDALTLRLVSAEADRDSARLDLDAERVYRRLDAEAAATREAGYLAALDAAKPPAAWRLPAAVVSGAAVAAGVAAAIAGHERTGAAIGIGGAVLVGAALAL